MTETAGLPADTLDLVIETLQEVLAKHLPPERMLELDHNEEFPTEVVKELLSPDVGMHLLFLPEDVGGLGGGARDVCRVSEEMAAVDLGVATAFLAIFLGIEPLLVGGTDEQKKRWLEPVAEQGQIVAYGVTEPEAGSNLASLKTTAERITDADGTVTGYRLNGTKQFITNGGVADLYTILANTPDGPSFFVVERGTPGLQAGKKEDKHGIRASNTTSVILDGVEVGADNLIGGVEGLGMKHASAVFGHTRLMVGAFGLGGGKGALECAIRYAHERVQFGGPLIEKDGYALKLLVPHLVDLAAGRAYVTEIAERLDASPGDLPVEGAIAKYWATEAGNRAADASIQALGGYGFMREYMVEKHKRDVRITTIYEGTSEILQSVIGMHRWKQHVRSHGELYDEQANSLETLHEQHSDVGADHAAIATHGLRDLFAYAQQNRLPRHQIALFALADAVTHTEVAGAFCRHAAARQAENADGAEREATMSRIFARTALTELSRVGRLCAVGLTEPKAGFAIETAQPLLDRLRPAESLRAQAGQWLDMRKVAATL